MAVVDDEEVEREAARLLSAAHRELVLTILSVAAVLAAGYIVWTWLRITL